MFHRKIFFNKLFNEIFHQEESHFFLIKKHKLVSKFVRRPSFVTLRLNWIKSRVKSSINQVHLKLMKKQCFVIYTTRSSPQRDLEVFHIEYLRNYISHLYRKDWLKMSKSSKDIPINALRIQCRLRFARLIKQDSLIRERTTCKQGLCNITLAYETGLQHTACAMRRAKKKRDGETQAGRAKEAGGECPPRGR